MKRLFRSRTHRMLGQPLAGEGLTEVLARPAF